MFRIFNLFKSKAPEPSSIIEEKTPPSISIVTDSSKPIELIDKRTGKFNPASVSVGVIVSGESSLVAAAWNMRDKDTKCLEICIKDNDKDGDDFFNSTAYRIIQCSGNIVAIGLSVRPGCTASELSKMKRNFPNIKFWASLGLTRGYIPEKEQSPAVLLYSETKQLLENTQNELLTKEKEQETKDNEWKIAQTRFKGIENEFKIEEKEFKETDGKDISSEIGEKQLERLKNLQKINLKRQQFNKAHQDSAEKEIQFLETKFKTDDLKHNLECLADQLKNLEVVCEREARLKASMHDAKDLEDAKLQLGDVVISGNRGVVEVSELPNGTLNCTEPHLPGSAWLGAMKSVEQESKMLKFHPMVKNMEYITHQFPENKQKDWQKPKDLESTRSSRVFESVIPVIEESYEYKTKNFFDKIHQLCKDQGALCIDYETSMPLDDTNFMIIRGINEYIDYKRNKDLNWWEFQHYASCAAVGYLRSVLTHISPAPKLISDVDHDISPVKNPSTRMDEQKDDQEQKRRRKM